MLSQSPIVRLRAPVADDVEARAALGTSAEIIRMYGYMTNASSSTMASDKALNWFEKLQAHACAWVIEADGTLAGEARIDNINEDDRRGRLAIGLFNEKFLGKGIGRQAIGLVLAHAFGPLRLHRIDLRVLSYNRRAIRCYEACGFLREGIERESALVGGEWHDDVIMAILEHEFRARAAAYSNDR